VKIVASNRGAGTMGYRVFRSELEDLRTRAGVFEQVAAMLSGGKNLTGAEHPQRLEIAVVSANYFSMLGTSAHIGRVFGPCNEVPGYGEAIAISDSLVGPRVRQTQAWCCVELSIQQTNAVKGTIRDSSGAIMQNVAVATEDTERGIHRTAISEFGWQISNHRSCSRELRRQRGNAWI